MARKDYFTRNLTYILETLEDKDYLTNDELYEILVKLKDKALLSKSLSFNSFLLKLIDKELKQFSIRIRGHSKIRYTMKDNFDIYDFCSTLDKNGYFPMTTSLNIQNLSRYRNSYIFVSKERAERVDFYDITLTQKSIDKAFSKAPRRTNAYDRINEYIVVMLEANNISSYEIIDFNGYKVSSINRAFVEIISNVHYFQASTNVIELFKQIKEELNPDTIYKVIEKFDFVYPYFQLAGFYLEEIGYKKKQLSKFYYKKSELIFYTQKNKDSYKINEYWNIKY